jgi:hypothetical protein
MGKKGKKDPNAPTKMAEDTMARIRKLIELKVAIKAPKPGQPFTAEEFCIPPVFHNEKDFKQIIHYWTNCAIVKHAERDLKVPSLAKEFEDECTAGTVKTFPRKEIQDAQKWLKKFAKQATKQTTKFMKQMDKKEAKETKRQNLIKQITEVDLQMNDELRASRKFVDRQELFNAKYMIGSKLGEKAPPKDALILIEQSDKMATWVDEAKDEVVKLLNEVINEQTETFNIGVFNAGGQATWCPQFQSKTDPKKGLADSIKWLGKNVSAKTCGAQAFPPDWPGMLTKFVSGEGVKQPFRIFICCSRAPPDQEVAGTVLTTVQELRQSSPPPAKNQPVLPISVVAFDPEIVGEQGEKEFLSSLAGPDGQSAIDTSAEDLLALDKMLKSVATKKKQLDKLNKKLDKMEDLHEQVAEMRGLFQMQIALQRMLESDLEICNLALAREEPVTVPDI